MSELCPNYLGCLDAFWTQDTELDTFWTSFGHILDIIWTHGVFGHVLDMIWTLFGYILDTFINFVSKTCPYPHRTGAPSDSERAANQRQMKTE